MQWDTHSIPPANPAFLQKRGGRGKCYFIFVIFLRNPFLRKA